MTVCTLKHKLTNTICQRRSLLMRLICSGWTFYWHGCSFRTVWTIRTLHTVHLLIWGGFHRRADAPETSRALLHGFC